MMNPPRLNSTQVHKDRLLIPFIQGDIFLVTLF